MRTSVTAALIVLAAAPGSAQSESALRQRFEGRTVVVRIDMPATAQGVDVEPGGEQPLDTGSYGYRLKSYGVAIRAGESVTVTRVKVKDKLIEFQLGGGGFGTFGDSSGSSVYIPSASKSAREKELERQVRDEKDAQRKKELQRELNDVRREREREDSRNKAVEQAAEAVKKDADRRRALEMGSRFNLRYRSGVPAAALTPDGLMRALAEYVDFSGRTAAAAEDERPAGRGPLRKGLTWDEVEDLLGSPETTSDHTEGSLKTKTAVFLRGDDRIEALFVEGVLVKYTISSK
ncbi:MAG TPA: hypothetical protein VGQ78_03420 [Vicinamibacteria bacterium]|jgi:hypothetical protein|nr:hypothetical protein [Vicinamibacteria bacterium]